MAGALFGVGVGALAGLIVSPLSTGSHNTNTFVAAASELQNPTHCIDGSPARLR